jgi:hypothetical protein
MKERKKERKERERRRKETANQFNKVQAHSSQACEWIQFP